MRSFAQNREDLIVLNYFNGHKGDILSIGENDGTTFSNARLLIQQGWGAYLVEPSPVAFELLRLLYRDTPMVRLFNVAISTSNGKGWFYESAEHVKGGNDVALVSSLHTHEVSKWADVKFKKIEVDFVTFKDFMVPIQSAKFDFISIDAEGSDWDILQQIDLKQVGCKCLCIEHNSKAELLFNYRKHAGRFGMKQIAINAENVIYAI